jgi:hypothetical protein
MEDEAKEGCALEGSSPEAADDDDMHLIYQETVSFWQRPSSSSSTLNIPRVVSLTGTPGSS